MSRHQARGFTRGFANGTVTTPAANECHPFAGGPFHFLISGARRTALSCSALKFSVMPVMARRFSSANTRTAIEFESSRLTNVSSSPLRRVAFAKSQPTVEKGSPHRRIPSSLIDSSSSRCRLTVSINRFDQGAIVIRPIIALIGLTE